MIEKNKNYSKDSLKAFQQGIVFSDLDEISKDTLIRELCQRILKLEERCGL
ncbi:hypothetical protein LCGC14_2979300 [marine sediment metagenome]|uniref:Uncharacterized protein n=1 Tax=marine sediment metagenome TaxID=412755 RepID=A0A0F8X749_9ZZZZ